MDSRIKEEKKVRSIIYEDGHRGSASVFLFLGIWPVELRKFEASKPTVVHATHTAKKIFIMTFFQ